MIVIGVISFSGDRKHGHGTAEAASISLPPQLDTARQIDPVIDGHNNARQDVHPQLSMGFFRDFQLPGVVSMKVEGDQFSPSATAVDIKDVNSGRVLTKARASSDEMGVKANKRRRRKRRSTRMTDQNHPSISDTGVVVVSITCSRYLVVTPPQNR